MTFMLLIYVDLLYIVTLIYIMEEQLEIAILAGANDEEMEMLILHNIIGIQNNVEEIQIIGFNNMNDEEFKNHFRFLRADIVQLKNVLRIPERFITESGDSVDGTTALCILLKRLCYPGRLRDLQYFFNRSSQSLSQIVKKVRDFLVERHERLLNDLNSHQWLDIYRYQLYAQAVRNMGGAIPNCWGFIDGTVRPICRPSVQQEEYYSGHKRTHCVKYQSVLCPDGLIVSLHGAFPGRRHDAGIFQETHLYQQFEQCAVFPNGNFVIYGDQAYGLRPLLLVPFPGHPDNLQFHEIAFNNSMKVLRVAVEWGFQKILSLFAFVDFKKNQKLLLSDIENSYKCAVLLTNCHSCFYGNQTSEYFNIIPPTIQQYIG